MASFTKRIQHNMENHPSIAKDDKSTTKWVRRGANKKPLRVYGSEKAKLLSLFTDILNAHGPESPEVLSFKHDYQSFPHFVKLMDKTIAVQKQLLNGELIDTAVPADHL